MINMLSRDDCITCQALYDKYQLHVYQLLGVQIARWYGRSGGTIADVGTGPGYLAVQLARLARAQVLALDINPAMLELAEAVVTRAGLAAQVSLVPGDVHDLPWPSDGIDLLVSYTCMHHWADPVRALSECYRVLRPGAQMILIDTRPVTPQTMLAFAEMMPEPEYYEIIEKAYLESIPEADVDAFSREARIPSAEISGHEFTVEDIMDCLEVGDQFEIPETTAAIDEPTLWVMRARKVSVQLGILMTVVNEESVLEPVPERPARKYLKGVIIEPGLALNSVAADMYQLLDGQRTLGDVVTRIATDYDVTQDRCLQDAVSLAAELIDEGVVRFVGQDGTG